MNRHPGKKKLCYKYTTERIRGDEHEINKMSTRSQNFKLFSPKVLIC